MPPANANIFSVRPAAGTQAPLRSAAAGVVDRVLALDQLSRVYQDAVARASPQAFVDRVLDVLETSYAVPDEDRQRIPPTGPLVVVANHSFGGVEGLILLSLLLRARPDVRVMANYLLHHAPAMREFCIFVDPFGTPAALRGNSRPLRASIRWLRGGGALGVFPSGEVARLDLRQRAVLEPAWSETVAGLVRATEAAVLPVYFDGANSALFHLLGLVHPRLRTALLPRQLVNKRRRCLPVRIGHVIPFARLQACGSDRAIMDHLRARTYLLASRASPAPAPRPAPWFPRRGPAPVAPALPPDAAAAEVAGLPPEQRLAASGDLEVWHARAPQIPALLHEIGRLREITFRDVGEGSGKALDLDHFDADYLHLFLWQRARAELVGAYRIGHTDEILPRRGRDGLYTSTLFRLDRDLLRALTPGLELGRSFIRKEYQRNHQSLSLIWKGIGAYILRHPRYRVLFGPVSISSQYQSVSRDLLVTFLRLNKSLPALARGVRPRRPVRPRRLRPGVPDPVPHASSLDEIEELISDVEGELRGVPILLKQYLKLGGRILDFNRDPKFGNCLDGLILVDLVEANPHVLLRYLGAEGLRGYLEHHGRPAAMPHPASGAR